MGDALGVVEPIHTKHDCARISELGTDLLRPRLHLGRAREFFETRAVDRDRECAGNHRAERALTLDLLEHPHPRRAVDKRHLDLIALGGIALESAHRALEVARVSDPLESDHVCSEEPLDDLGAPRQLGVDAIGREGDVIEEADSQVWADLAQQLRHELQLIILDPDHR
jgi:hypothetical protein